MSHMDVKAVEALIPRVMYPPDDYEGWWRWEGHIDEAEDFFGLGTITLLDESTGHEGDYDKATYMVFRIDWNDGEKVYYKRNGRYQSFDGSHWDALEIVTPRVKEVIVYD